MTNAQIAEENETTTRAVELIEKTTRFDRPRSHGECRELVSLGLAKIERDWSTCYILTEKAQPIRRAMMRRLAADQAAKVRS